MFMFMNEHPVAEIMDVCHLVYQEIAPLRRILKNKQEEPVNFTKLTYAVQSARWGKHWYTLRRNWTVFRNYEQT